MDRVGLHHADVDGAVCVAIDGSRIESGFDMRDSAQNPWVYLICRCRVIETVGRRNRGDEARDD